MKHHHVMLSLFLCAPLAAQTTTTATVTSAPAGSVQPETVTTNVPSGYTAKDKNGGTVTPGGTGGAKVTHKGAASFDHKNKTVTITQEIVEVSVWSEEITLADLQKCKIENEKQNAKITVTGAKDMDLRLKKRCTATVRDSDGKVRADERGTTIDVAGGSGEIDVPGGCTVTADRGWRITTR